LCARATIAAANATLFAVIMGMREMRTTIKFLEMAIGGALLLGLGAYIVHGLVLIAGAVL
jgi:hypothetical protein